MSKIQAVFNGTGRELRDTERRSMDDFVARYLGALTTPPGSAKVASSGTEQSKTRQVTANAQPLSLLDKKKMRLKIAMLKRQNRLKISSHKAPKKAVTKASGF